MVQNIINSINTWQDWYRFTDKVEKSETYKHSWFVYTDCFNELPCGAKAPDEVIIAKGLTEAEAKRIYEANKYAVENCGTDYADIYMANLYSPYDGAEPYVYERATGEHVSRAFELKDISDGVTKKLKRMGLYN
jgi:deoxyadenosine/deoxycytidine kinase